MSAMLTSTVTLASADENWQMAFSRPGSCLLRCVTQTTSRRVLGSKRLQRWSCALREASYGEALT